MKKISTLVYFILVSQLAGVIGSFFTVTGIESWYMGLNKPFFNPPNWIFGPMWIILYCLMGLAAYFVYLKRREKYLAKYANILFFIHLVLNGLWSIIFFGLKNPSIAFFEIIILWILIFVLLVIYFQVDKRSFYLFIPYILWVSFAAMLNFSIWQLN